MSKNPTELTYLWDNPRWDDPVWKFMVWFAEPIEKLKELRDGSGAFAAFIVGLAWYQRLILARLDLKGASTGEDSQKDEIARDLKLSDGERSIFWRIFRTGLLHGAMPLAGKTNFIFHHSYSGYPEFKKVSDGASVICINPWKFADRVVQEFLSNPNLITASDSFPLANVVLVSPDNLP